MAFQQQPLSYLNSSSSSSSSSSCNLYCQEEEEEERYPYWGDKEDVVLEDDEELLCLFSKEQQQQQQQHIRMDEDVGIDEGVEWMVKAAISHCGFSILTAVLAINYMRRFLSTFPIATATDNNKKKKKPWMIQLVAVTCLSLAAKVEEIHVPLLIDLQVGEAKYVFEAKTIQRMELVVLSTLKWKMHPITPLSFLDHFLRTLPLNTQQLHYHFHFHFLLNTSHLLILSLLSDSRSMRFLPSVLAAATMMHLVHQLDPTNSLQCNNHLLRLLRITKEKVDGCYQLIEEIMSTSRSNRKRKLESSPHLLSSKEKENEEEEDSSRSSSSSLTKRSRLFMENNKSCGNGKFASLNHAFAIGSDH